MTMKFIKHSAQLACLFSTLFSVQAYAASNTETPAKPEALSLSEFIKRATANDVRFEAILIDQMPLQYQKQLQLPDSDLIMDIKYQYNFYLDQDRNNPEGTISLSKLFPYNGTEVSLTYGKSSSIFSNAEDASLELLVSQPIANNAFGKSTRLQSQIIDIESDITRYQVIEAYEDYLASLTAVYYNWYSSWENLKTGRLSYQSNQQLMANILERQRQKIALPIDVNKMKLLLTGKQESLIVLQEVYDTYANMINRSIANNSSLRFHPVKPDAPAKEIRFSEAYDTFINESRTHLVFKLLEKQDDLEVAKVADELLPSTKLLLGYKLQGDGWSIDQSNDNLFAGISVSWPLGHTKSQAKKEIAEIAQRKTTLNNLNAYAELKVNLQNLALQIKREKKLIELSKEKIRLAEAILKDEAENYSYGKVSLNDYITAVNRLDEIRFSYTDHTVQLNKLMIEWLRLTDQLVNQSVLRKKPQH